MVLSALALAMSLPPGWMTTLNTEPICPDRFFSTVPVLIRQSLRVVSLLPLARNWLPGKKATVLTSWVAFQGLHQVASG